MPHRSDIVDVAGVQTHLFRGGRGEPVLVLHPEFASNRWCPYHDALAARFRILAPDHPGFGRSECPDWIEGIDDLVFHYLDLLAVLGLERVSIVGTSLGGWIAAELAVAHPERIDRLVLVGAAGLKVDGVDRFDVFVHSFEETLSHLFHDAPRAAQLRPIDDSIESALAAYREATTLARLSWNPYLYGPKLERRLRRVRAKTLIVWGANDRYLPLAHGEAYAARIADARLSVVPDCGHLVPLEQTAAFTQLVSEFLAGPMQ